MNTIVRLDTRGRLVIPNEFRESLDLKEGDNVLISLDPKTNTLSISPIYGEENNLVKLEIEFGDTPGCLAKIATKLAELNIDLIMTCGPEVMMKRVLDIADSKNIEIQASLERKMKCGVGLCGSCCLAGESNVSVCKEGPIFTSKQLKEFPQFGTYSK